MSCVVGCRWGSDLALLWLWLRPAAVAPFGHLAWEPPYAASMALKSRKKKKKERKKEKKEKKIKRISVLSNIKFTQFNIKN